MEKFLKLLNPWETVGDDIFAVGRQQKRAEAEFPKVVERSNLHYWRPGDSITTEGTRYLIALAASYSLYDLRFADVINEALLRPFAQPVRIDVFNIYDYKENSEFSQYFPDIGPKLGYIATPIVGVWKEGVHEETLFIHDARKRVLHDLKSRYSAEEVVSGLSPPHPKLMED